MIEPNLPGLSQVAARHMGMAATYMDFHERMEKFVRGLPTDGSLPPAAAKEALALAQSQAYEAILMWRTAILERDRLAAAIAAEERRQG